jgi:1-deoxy-D-xylulose-5-phosphate reductoisomerase
MKTVAVVGSTGSIGTQTIDVVADAPGDYRITSLAAGRSVAALAAQATQIQPDVVVIGDESLVAELRAGVPDHIRVEAGPEAMAAVAAEADVTVNGVVGFAGLGVTLACLEAGKRLALANKESLIAAGPVAQKARRTPGAELVPVDSEHAAIHQCLRSNEVPKRVKRIQVTASGGPFRGRTRDQLESVGVADALAHPTWSMGPKITIDSSTLMNKGLEVIEANELFGKPAGDAGYGIGFDEIDVVVHPQSIVHSMVTFSDGSTIAQLSHPTMMLPIAYALAYPDRAAQAYGEVDWANDLANAGTLEFFRPDTDAFPCLGLAFEAGRLGGTAPAWISAANEVAVEAFLKEKIRWVDISDVISDALSVHDGDSGDTLEGVLAGDAAARAVASEAVRRRGV